MSETGMEKTPVEVVTSTALESITRGEIDVQIATAHRYPRSIADFTKRAKEMVSLDEETAMSCIYSRPVGGGKFAEGMSIRMAEIVGACYGNLRVGAVIVEQAERFVTARGMAHDLESNFASSCEVIESTVDKYGKPYNERMRVVVAKAALAKARRDATFQVVPKAMCKTLYDLARDVAVGKGTTIASRRTKVMEWIAALGIDPARVFAAIGVRGEEDLGADDLVTLTGLRTAIKDGDVSADEAFPVVAKKPNFVGGDAPPKEPAAPRSDPSLDTAEDVANSLASPPAPTPVDEANRIGAQIYGDKWEAKRVEMCRDATKGAVGALEELSPPELTALLDKLNGEAAAALQGNGKKGRAAP